jgi:hypothetical protein
MRWLERLRGLEEKFDILENGTAKTAKSPFSSFCSASPQEYEVSQGGAGTAGGAAVADTNDPTRCAHCGEGERSGVMIVPFGTETTGHTWLHSECWRAWYMKRRGL